MGIPDVCLFLLIQHLLVCLSLFRECPSLQFVRFLGEGVPKAQPVPAAPRAAPLPTPASPGAGSGCPPPAPRTALGSSRENICKDAKVAAPGLPAAGAGHRRLRERGETKHETAEFRHGRREGSWCWAVDGFTAFPAQR